MFVWNFSIQTFPLVHERAQGFFMFVKQDLDFDFSTEDIVFFLSKDDVEGWILWFSLMMIFSLEYQFFNEFLGVSQT
jgi:hypothetical protein